MTGMILAGPRGPQGLPSTVAGPQGPAGTGMNIVGSLPNVGALPATGNAGEGYLIGGNLHVWDGGAWVNVGNIQGPAGAAGPQGVAGPQGNDAVLTPDILRVAPHIDANYLFAESMGVHGTDYVSPTNIGANKSAAMTLAIEAAISQNKTLVLPPHFINLASKVEWDNPDDLKLRIQGQGSGTTKLLATGNGGFRFRMSNIARHADIQLKGFSISAADPSGATLTPRGRALEIVRDPAPSLRGLRELFMDDIGVESFQNDQGYFERQVYIEGLWFPKLTNVRANQLMTANLSDAANAYRNNWIAYQPESALHVKKCYGLFVEDSMFKCGGGDIGFGAGAPVMFDNGGSAEGGMFRNCTSNFGKVGVLLRGSTNEPGFEWQQGHINARDTLAFIYRGKNITFEGVLLYLDDGGGVNTSASGIPRLFSLSSQSGSDISLINNQFHFAQHTNIGQLRYIDSAAAAGQVYRLHGNTTNVTAPPNYGFISSNQHRVFATGNEFADAGFAAWSNDGASGYQYESAENGRRRIVGFNTPNGKVMAGVLTNGDTYVDPSLMAGSDHWRLTDAATQTWTRY